VLGNTGLFIDQEWFIINSLSAAILMYEPIAEFVNVHFLPDFGRKNRDPIACQSLFFLLYGSLLKQGL